MPDKTLMNLPKGTVLPDHIAIILDGNRRWARAAGKSPIEGHKAGAAALKNIVRTLRGLNVHTLTVWGFSTENWERPTPEIEKIMMLVEHSVEEIRREADDEGVRFVHIGRKDRLPPKLAKLIAKVEEQTRNNSKYILNVALDYGGRDEIVRAVRKIVEDKIDPSRIDEKLFSGYLDTHDQPYPNVDLFIRTSGEQRTSGFLPWQLNYAEYYWEVDHLPDMSTSKVREILLDYSRRRRRFGGNDNLGHFKFRPQILAKFELAWWRLSKIPAGTKFSEYAANHLKEQWGMTSSLATSAARYMLQAMLEGNASKWERANAKLRKFYKLIRDEVKLAFEPSIAASLEVKLMQKASDQKATAGDIEQLSRDWVAEVWRISDFQAAKAGHLRALATVEKNLADEHGGEEHWKKAEDYLEKYYQALKERVA